MKDSFRRQIIVKISLAFVAVILMVGAIFFLNSLVSAKAGFIFSTRSDLNNRINLVNQLTQLKAAAAEATPYIEKLSKALPPRDALLSLQVDLNDIAHKYSLGFGFKFVGEESKIGNNIKSAPFQINIQGTYPNIINFLKDLESGSYFISLSDADIVGSPTSYNASISGQIFFNG